MKLGIAFPTHDIGSDPIAIRDFAQSAEAAGFDYISTIDHVAGAHLDRFTGVDIGFSPPPYLYDIAFHEPLCLFSYLAAITTRVELFTGILVLPQRQTVLVAKQAAEVALLSSGRLTLGVGIGWNFAEFEALDEDFHNRGRRVEEQIEVMRLLWDNELVDFEGKWHRLDRVGINPRPARQIPIWMGGGNSERVMKRIARLADGWMPNLGPPDQAEATIRRMNAYLLEAGREEGSLQLESGLNPLNQERGELVASARRLRGLGVTHLRVGGADRLSPSKLLEAAGEARLVLQDEGFLEMPD